MPRSLLIHSRTGTQHARVEVPHARQYPGHGMRCNHHLASFLLAQFAPACYPNEHYPLHMNMT